MTFNLQWGLHVHVYHKWCGWRFYPPIEFDRPFYGNVTAQVFANPGWKTMESHKCKSKTDHSVCNNVQTYSNIVLILLTWKQLIMGGILFNWKFAGILDFVKTSVNTIECFTNIRPTKPTKAVCLSTKERSITGTLLIQSRCWFPGRGPWWTP